MASVTGFLVNSNLKRFISTSTVNYAKSYAMREGKFMNKLMKRDVGKRKWCQSRPPAPGCSGVGGEKFTSSHVTRRVTVLNKLFMQHITDLMATGDVSTELVGQSIEITHVKITPDFKFVLVFWGSKKANEGLEELLNDCAFRIRHELTQLRVIGQVPLIKFVRNRQIAGLTELDKRLKTADYGEDFECTIFPHIPRPELTLEASLSPEIREKILKLEDPFEEEEDEDDSKYDVDMPPMRRDVLGLDHNAIMNRVMLALKKSQEGPRNRLLNVTTILPSETAPQLDPTIFQSSKEDSEAFTEFLVKRQIEEKRKLRRECKDSALEYNLRREDFVYEVDDSFVEDEKDDDPFEDISLESLK